MLPKLKEAFTNKYLLLFLLFLGACLFVSVFTVSKSSSVPYRFWWSIPIRGEIKEGDYFTFFETHPYRHKRTLFLKKVSCTPGSMLSKEGRCFYCDGNPIGCAKEFNLKGESVQIFDYGNFKVPQGFYFMTGDHKDSYDSRYLGFVDKKRFINRLVPVFPSAESRILLLFTLFAVLPSLFILKHHPKVCGNMVLAGMLFYSALILFLFAAALLD